MKNRIRNSVLFLLLCLSSYAYAQNPYNVEYNEVRGSLKSSDKYKKDFGRYHGFELPLYEGEKANFALFSSDFNARIVLVDPKGKVYKQSEEARDGMVSILTKIPISGDWILYVVGGKNDTGQFALRYAFAASNSLNISSNMDFCSSLNFLIAHAAAHFMMFPIEQLDRSGMELIGKEGKAEIDEKDGSLNITIYEGADENRAKTSFNDTYSRIANCIGDWNSADLHSKNEKEEDILNGKIFSEKGNKDGVKVLLKMIRQNNSTDYNKISYKILLTVK